MRKSTKITICNIMPSTIWLNIRFFYEYYLRFHLFDNQLTINCKFQMYFHGGVCIFHSYICSAFPLLSPLEISGSSLHNCCIQYFYVAVFLLEGYANLSALVQLNIIDCILCVEQSLRRIPSLRFIGFLHSGRCGFTVCILSNYK